MQYPRSQGRPWAALTEVREVGVSDLVTRLTDAATAAIENETPALTYPVGRVVGLTIELVIDGAGQIRESVACVERRTQGGRCWGGTSGRSRRRE